MMLMLRPADPRELVSLDPATEPIAGFAPPVVAKQADATLDRLLEAVFKARCAMRVELRLSCKRQRQMLVQRRLLTALEMYASALSARGLLAPPKLRDELTLQRGLGSARRAE
jgi:hypothetical protein